MRRLRVLTWHVHGNYLYYLTQAPHDFYLPVKPGRPHGYGGRSGSFAWGDNVYELAADEVDGHDFDLVLFQARVHYFENQYELLSAAQRRGPVIYLEHDPPREIPTDTRHPVNDPNVLLVQVTPFNDLMWDSGRTPARVIEHGVLVPDDIRYSGELPRGLVVVNNLARRGRRLGADLFERARREVPLDLVGMESEVLGGLGEIQPDRLAAFQVRYRLFFNPIRYTSLGLAVCEAMMLGMPIIGLATTEMATAVENGVTGYVDTRLDRLIDRMGELLADPPAARRLGRGAQAYARERFGIERFARDWDATFREVAGGRFVSTSATTIGAQSGSDQTSRLRS